MKEIERHTGHLLRRPVTLARAHRHAVRAHESVKEELFNVQPESILQLFGSPTSSLQRYTAEQRQRLTQLAREAQAGVQVQQHLLETRTGAQSLMTLRLDEWMKDDGLQETLEPYDPAEKISIMTTEKKRVIERCTAIPFIRSLQRKQEWERLWKLAREAHGWADEYTDDLRGEITQHIVQHLANVMQIEREHRKA